MKKSMLILFTFLLAISQLSAQNKGERYLEGNLSFNLGLANSSYRSGNLTTKERIPVVNQFGLIPSFGYFAADNFEINVHLKYALGVSGMYDDDDTYFKIGTSGSHIFSAGVGMNYHIRLCNRFYYTPGMHFDFGVMNLYSTTYQTTYSYNMFYFGLGIDLARFDVRITDKFGVNFSLLTMSYELGTENHESLNALSFNSGKIGFRYYF